MNCRSLIFLFFISAFFISCGADQEERIRSAVESARIDLSRGDCDSAIKRLELEGNQSGNAPFVITFASAYACRAGYSSPTFFSTDLALVDATNFLSSFTLFSTSSLSSSPDTDSSFLDLAAAINLLLFSGELLNSVSPTSGQRRAKFSSRESAQIHSLLMFLLMAELGKFMDYFGNTSSVGNKGEGTDFTNKCFLDYADLPLAVTSALLGVGSSGNCTSANLSDGHQDLRKAGGVDVDLACYGIVYFNALLDVIPEVISSAAGSDFTALDTIQGSITNLKAALALITGSGSDILNETNYTTCVADNTLTDDNVQYFYAAIFEQLHNKN